MRLRGLNSGDPSCEKFALNRLRDSRYNYTGY